MNIWSELKRVGCLSALLFFAFQFEFLLGVHLENVWNSETYMNAEPDNTNIQI